MDINWTLSISSGLILIGMVVVTVISLQYQKEKTPKVALLLNIRNMAYFMALILVLTKLSVPWISMVDYSSLTELKAPDSFFLEKNNRQLNDWFRLVDVILMFFVFVMIMVGSFINRYIKAINKTQ
jgi:hypothetical protein